MKSIAFILMGIGLMGLGGCATTIYSLGNVNGDEYFDSHGDYRLIERNNDIYMEKLDKSEAIQITHTPQIIEKSAWFTKNGNYIVYFDETTPDGTGGYLIKTEEGDSKKIRISEDEARNLRYQK